MKMDHLRHQKYKNKRSKHNFKIINISINDMHKFENEELTNKRTFTKNTWYGWYDWLINYIPEPIEKTVGGVKEKIMVLFKTKDYSKPEPVKIVYRRGKKLRKLKTQNIRNPFTLKKKEIKDRIIRDIWTLYETEEGKKEEKK